MLFSKFFSRLLLPFIALAMLGTLLAACADSPTATNFPPSSIAPAPTTGSAAPPTGPTGAATTNPATANASVTAAPATTASAPGATPTPGQGKLAAASAIITKADGTKLNMTVELARTGQEQETGLMGRLSVPDDTGMLFIFPNSGRVAFWMKDTPLALSIAFITQDGKIIDIQDMEPFSLDTHQPNQDYIYALEVAKGYFAKKGVKPGDIFTFQG